jgi:D-beta-D-heptose 7-phosphate kinase/D-beta-D-heptose 1-phosphate adenosyltransferase
MTVLSSLQAVNWLVEFGQDTPEDLVNAILPDVLVKGGDYKVEEIVGSKAVTANGGEVKVIDYVDSKSTSGIISKIKNS